MGVEITVKRQTAKDGPTGFHPTVEPRSGI
jgi:hypothetical protein